MSSRVYVAGVGMIPFSKPGASESYHVMGAQAAELALQDAGIDYRRVQQAYASYVYGDSTCGQAALYEVGLSGIPIVNLNNNCSSGSSALFLARQAVASGAVECALAVGFEQMNPGALKSPFEDRRPAVAGLVEAMERAQGYDPSAPRAAQFFAGAGRDYMREFGASAETFAHISVKARQHAARNPFAVFRKPVTVEEVMAAPMIFDPLTRLQCCPPTCGAAAVVVCSEAFAKSAGLDGGVYIAAQAMTTDTPSTFESGDMRKVVGYDMTVDAARQVYEHAGVGPSEVDVVELHDCFTAN